MEQELRTTPPETQVCKCCGRELPIGNFTRGGFGLLKTCKECQGKKAAEVKGRKKVSELDDLRRQLQEARTLRLSDFKPRELMIRLKELGYEGTLSYVERHTIDITKVD